MLSIMWEDWLIATKFQRIQGWCVYVLPLLKTDGGHIRILLLISILICLFSFCISLLDFIKREPSAAELWHNIDFCRCTTCSHLLATLLLRRWWLAEQPTRAKQYPVNRPDSPRSAAAATTSSPSPAVTAPTPLLQFLFSLLLLLLELQLKLTELQLKLLL